MEKIKFMFEGTEESAEFYILEQTTVSGVNYILVTDSEEEEDAECMILRDTSAPEDADSVYEVVEDDAELRAVMEVFEELLEDVDIELD